MTLIPEGDMTRRSAIAAVLGASFAPRAVAASFAEDPFRLGVASGDPSADGFVIWTRLAPRPEEPAGGLPPLRYDVGWEVSSDDQFRNVTRRGVAIARPELGHAVHVEVAGLEPRRPYWYRFTAGGVRSPAGRGRTLPAPGATVDRLRFAVAGCQHFEQGHFTAWRKIAEQDFDFLVHYGDYIYEMGANEQVADPRGGVYKVVRLHAGDALYSLDDYRRRHAQYKTDVDLQAAHASTSFFVTFDDHEVANNWTGLHDGKGAPPELFALRRMAAFQAYYEHMPLRRTSLPGLAGMRMHRRALFGTLMQAHFLDSRQYRSPQPCGDKLKPICPEVERSEADILGPEQEAWLFDNLRSEPSRWNLLAQQVMMMDLDRRTRDEGDVPVINMDDWPAYKRARQRLLDHIHGCGLTNVVVATGDEHQNYAGEIRLGGWSSDTPVVASEFVATSITTAGDGSDLRPGAAEILERNPHCQLLNDQRGYCDIEVTPALWRTDFKVLDKVSEPGGALSTRARFVIEPGSPKLERG